MKKALSLALVAVMLFTLGFLAFADDAQEVETVQDAPVQEVETVQDAPVIMPDNPERTRVNVVPVGAEMEENKGCVVWNEGTINNNAEYEPQTETECANGFILVNTVSGTVQNNKGEIDTNAGDVSYNEGKVDTNTGFVDTNAGLVEWNAGAIAENTGTVRFNNKSDWNESGFSSYIDNNNGTVDMNTGVVFNSGDNAIVNNNFGMVIKGETDSAGVTKYKEDSVSYSVAYTDGDVLLSHYNVNGEYNESSTIWPVVPITVESSEAFGLSKFGHKGAWVVKDALGLYDGLLVDAGDSVALVGYADFKLVWQKVLNADICFEDVNGAYEGRSFLLNQPLENFQNVSCNAAYLEKGVDYTVEAEDGMTRIELTDKFFEKNGDGPIAVAPLFVGAIYYLYAVNR